MSDAVVVVLAAVVGLIFGSFGTVVAHRVPRRETIVSGRSRCPECGHTISAWENVPLMSYVLLRGRCRGCGARIPARYPAIELACGILFALAFWKFGAGVEAVAYAAFFWVLVVLSVIDIDHHLLPNRIVLPAFVAGWVLLGAAALLDDDLLRLRDAALGAALFSGFLFLAGFLYELARKAQGMGMGDVKLALVLGTFLGYLGPSLVLVGIFLSLLLGTVISIAWMASKGAGTRDPLPFGPALALGTAVTVFLGRPMLDAYLGLF